MEIFLIYTIAFLSILLATSLYFLWKFAKIIMIFEDDIDETLETLDAVESSIDQVLHMPMFFDSDEIKEAVQAALDELRLCRSSVTKIVHKFVDRSKRKYVTTWDVGEELLDKEQLFLQENNMANTPRLPGQPPGTPNPLKILEQEGMTLDVRNQNNRGY